MERNLGIIRNNLQIIAALIDRHADDFQWVAPRAGSMAFPRYLGEDVESFCDTLVREAGVLLLPGSVYDEHDNHFRLGLGRKNLPQAVARLEEFLAKTH